MTQLQVNQQTAQELEQLARQTHKSVDELLRLLLDNYSETVIDTAADDAGPEAWTEAEVTELLSSKAPLTGKQIAEAGLLGGWEDMGIEDSVAWLAQQRAKRSKKFQW